MIKKTNRAIAAMAVPAVVAAACGIAYVSTSDTSSGGGSGFCAEMPDAVGLYTGNPVTQMGVKVGKVTSIVPKADHVEVTFSLDDGRRYPADVKAVTRSKSLLADRSVELVGNYKSGSQLASGKCIALGNSFTPKSISQITGSAADFIEAIAPEDGGQGLRRALAGMETALHGNGNDAQAMMRHAAAAMDSPDQLISDIGAAIMNMAPLSEEALQRWSAIRSILDQAPAVVNAVTYDLLPGVIELCEGVGYTGKTLYDVQRRYGDQIWPFMHGSVTDVIHLAATRSKDIAGLLSVIPSVTAVIRQQTRDANGMTVTYQQPIVETGAGAVPTMPLLDLVLGKAER
ncbi:MlaD family protein [Nocardia abscessus]|jgi:phospholipid/cholesterol/gamma-HCH transport system substrate-binding protein|uniref:MlaD family protein n=1 Tax=Nocardia TaxID=1817 RepID=UPI001E474EBC|nr:MlaD family protein [Nocardia abscessus]